MLDMTLIQITIYVLIVIGVIACIFALVWTKIIKPNKFGYTNKNFLVKKEFTNLIKKMEIHSKIKIYENLYLNFDKVKPIYIERMVVTIQNVYLIANPLESKVIDIRENNGNIKMIYKNKELDLPLDVDILLASAKILKKEMEQKNLKIIIPVSNEYFVSKIIQSNHFVQKDDLFNYLNKLDNEVSNFDYQQFIQLINLKTIRKKPKKIFDIKKTS